MGCLVQLAANYASSFVGFHRGSMRTLADFPCRGVCLVAALFL